MTIMSEIQKTTKWDIRFLRLAREISGWSKDPSTKVGSVITGPQNQVWSLGFNGFPQGVFDDTRGLGDRNYKLLRMVHAESNALAFAERSIEGGTIYVYPFLPCASCAGVIIQRRLARVVTMNNFPERWETSFNAAKDMFTQAGVSTSYYFEKDLLNEY